MLWLHLNEQHNKGNREVTTEKNDRYSLLNHREVLLHFWLTWECVYNFHLNCFGVASSFPFHQVQVRAIL